MAQISRWPCFELEVEPDTSRGPFQAVLFNNAIQCLFFFFIFKLKLLKADFYTTEKSPEESLKPSPVPGRLRDIQNSASTSLLGLSLQVGTFHIPHGHSVPICVVRKYFPMLILPKWASANFQPTGLKLLLKKHKSLVQPPFYSTANSLMSCSSGSHQPVVLWIKTNNGSSWRIQQAKREGHLLVCSPWSQPLKLAWRNHRSTPPHPKYLWQAEPELCDLVSLVQLPVLMDVFPEEIPQVRFARAISL